MSKIFYNSQINIPKKRQNISDSRLRKKIDNSKTDINKSIRKTFERLSELEQKQILKRIKLEYSLIIFDYFASKDSINKKIEEFSEEAFALNLPIDQIIKIHLDAIDNLKRQLILEGLHADCLNDFRLTLIDVIARVEELYRTGCKYKIVA